MRFGLHLLVHKLNLVKALRKGLPVIKLSLGCATFNIVYHMVRRWFAMRRRKSNRVTKDTSLWLSQEFELSLACALASLGFSLAPTNDIRILKVVIFSRAVTSLVTYLGEATGLFRPLENDGPESPTRVLTTEYFLAVAGCFFIYYCFIVYPKSMPPSLYKTITRAMDMNSDEKRLFECVRIIHELEPRLVHWNIPKPLFRAQFS